MKASEVLRNARALIEKPENWTQGAYARDVNGTPMASLTAHAYSAAGAVWKVAEDRKLTRAPHFALGELRLALGLSGGHGSYAPIEDYNDTHTHAEVLSLFDRAIAAAEARRE